MDTTLALYLILGTNFLTFIVLELFYLRRLAYFKGIILANYKSDFEALAALMLTEEQAATPRQGQILSDEQLTDRLRKAGVR